MQLDKKNWNIDCGLQVNIITLYKLLFFCATLYVDWPFLRSDTQSPTGRVFFDADSDVALDDEEIVGANRLDFFLQQVVWFNSYRALNYDFNYYIHCTLLSNTCNCKTYFWLVSSDLGRNWTFSYSSAPPDGSFSFCKTINKNKRWIYLYLYK